jgi:cell wall-associated NlpC family hydrolase
MMSESEERSRVVAAARSWIATPYHDCACVKGHGVDCAFLIKAAFEEAGLEPPIAIEAYSPTWMLHRSEEKFLAKVFERATEIAEANAKPGDLVVYKFGRTFSHGAIIVDPGFPAIIHAYKQAGIVTLGEGDQGDLAVIGQGEVGPAHAGKPRPRRFFTRKAWAAT